MVVCDYSVTAIEQKDSLAVVLQNKISFDSIGVAQVIFDILFELYDIVNYLIERHVFHLTCSPAWSYVVNKQSLVVLVLLFGQLLYWVRSCSKVLDRSQGRLVTIWKFTILQLINALTNARTSEILYFDTAFSIRFKNIEVYFWLTSFSLNENTIVWGRLNVVANYPWMRWLS